jgi:hypothetical protein
MTIPLWCLKQPNSCGQQQAHSNHTQYTALHQNIPTQYTKEAVWRTGNAGTRYYAKSNTPEESGVEAWYPVEFNSEHICWVEIHWQEPAGSKGYWQAFCIAGEDLGLDITQQNVEDHIGGGTYRESVASSHTSQVSTPSIPSIIQPRPSPYQPGSRDQEIADTLAESLHINNMMSTTLTMEVPAGPINQTTGHINEDDVTLYRAIGPDQLNPTQHNGKKK